VDVSSAISTSTWDCIHQNGYSFAVVRCYEQGGHPDPNCPSTIRNAWAAGLAHVDAYIFPCFPCGDPAGQISTMVNYLHNNNAKFGMIWLDIEGPQYWSSDPNTNIRFINAMISQARAVGVKVGVYSSHSQWQPITGGWTGASSLPIWYAHYDDNPSFSDWQNFGGWTRPAIKQYWGDRSLCGADVDQNWYP